MSEGIDVALAIDAEATTVVRRRLVGGFYAPGGQWMKGTVEDTEFAAEVQPTTGRQLQDLPEGVRAEARCLLWTRLTDLMLDDVVIYEGDEYRVVYKWNRQRSGNYTRVALGMLKPEETTAYGVVRR